MAVHIRLRRMGSKKRPFYRIVAADSRRARDGRFLEVLGTYNPIEKPALVKIQEDRMSKWLDDGAVPSDTVSSLLTQVGFTEKYYKMKSGADVSEIIVKATISERKKKTRKAKKAAAAAVTAAAEAETAKKAEEAAKAEAEKAEAAKAAEAPAEETPAEEAPVEETKIEDSE